MYHLNLIFTMRKLNDPSKIQNIWPTKRGTRRNEPNKYKKASWKKNHREAQKYHRYLNK